MSAILGDEVLLQNIGVAAVCMMSHGAASAATGGARKWALRAPLIRLLFGPLRPLQSEQLKHLSTLCGLEVGTLQKYLSSSEKNAFEALLGEPKRAAHHNVYNPKKRECVRAWLTKNCNASKSGDRSERLERTMSKHDLYQRYRAECADPVSECVFTRMLVDLRVHKAKHPDFDTFSCPSCRTMASERRLYEAALARNPQHPLKNKMEQRLCL